MKKISIAIAVLIIGIAAQAQVTNSYNVVKVTGKVYNNTQKQDMFTGAVLNTSDLVEFNSMSNSAFVISKDNGRFVMVPSNSLSATASAILKPLSKRTAMTTRGESNVVLPKADLFEYFGKDKFLFIEHETKVWIDPNTFKLDKDKIMIAKYINAEGKSITKKLTVIDDKLSISLNDVFTEKDAKGSLVLYPLEIFTYNTSNKELALKAKFTPTLVNKDEFTGELKVIIGTMTNETDKTKIYEEIESFVYASYGAVNPTELKQFLKTTYNFE